MSYLGLSSVITCSCLGNRLRSTAVPDCCGHRPIICIIRYTINGNFNTGYVTSWRPHFCCQRNTHNCWLKYMQIATHCYFVSLYTNNKYITLQSQEYWDRKEHAASGSPRSVILWRIGRSRSNDMGIRRGVQKSCEPWAPPLRMGCGSLNLPRPRKKKTSARIDASYNAVES